MRESARPRPSNAHGARVPVALTLALAAACTQQGADTDPAKSTEGGAVSDASTSAATTTESTSAGTDSAGTSGVTSTGEDTTGGYIEPDVWEPGISFPTPREPTRRGLLDRRGLIHAHSVHSHDACDYEPKDERGVPDEECAQDFHRGLCRAQHDFVMLTDHNESFSSTPFTDALLYRAERGDALLEREGQPVANMISCAEVDAGAATEIRPLVLAGCESGTMPVALAGHVSDDEAERAAIYGSDSADSIAALKAGGAVVLVAHTEDYTPAQLIETPLDGFEMYNLHANLMLNLGKAAVLVAKVEQGDPGLPHPALALLPIITEDPAYLDTWSMTLAAGARRVTTMGTDCHRNTFPQLMADGDRVDSYERMMRWFSNHLLVEPGPENTFDERQLRDALAAGRLYGAFELLGFPVGFDFHALEADALTREIGGESSLASAPALRVTAPTLYKLDPAATRPLLTLRLLRATAEGWEEVATASADEGAPLDLEHTPDQPGAYRAEVRMTPRHLAGYVGEYSDLLTGDFVWIYSNPIYIVE